MSEDRPPQRNGRLKNGRLKIDMPFEEAVKAALEVKPKGKVGNGKPAGKPRAKKAAKQQK